MLEQKSRRLSEVINYIKSLIDSQLEHKRFWLKAEISNVNFHNSGHCYIDFTENQNGNTIAQCRATIWASSIQSIRSELGTDFINILKKGGEILCNVEVSFNQVYGLTLNIWSIDKYFALGELERRKQETVKRLQTENLVDRNKVYRLPLVIQRIAVVGSIGTSGHTDFLKQLEHNEYGYKFEIRNFPCQVQGDKAESEITLRLNELTSLKFDVIVLIRGGGSKLDLEVFNSYELAKRIALHTIPILTGIGHETDVSVADLVANQYFKTPSALGAFIVSRNHNFENSVNNTYGKVTAIYDSYLQRQNHRIRQCLTEFQTASISFTRLRRGNLHTTGNRIAANIKDKLSKQNQFQHLAKQTIQSYSISSISSKQNRLAEITNLLSLKTTQTIKANDEKIAFYQELAIHCIRNRIVNEQDFLINCGRLIDLYHTDNVLKRGYSITRLDGMIVGESVSVKKGDEIEIEFINKRITASVVSIQPKT
jgi:exodeoxyribonuclease VII large subunit